MCGISGVALSSNTLRQHIENLKHSRHPLINALHSSIRQIQHRGYDGAGIAFLDGSLKKISLIKQRGMVDEVFNSSESAPILNNRELVTWSGIAHTRYKTVGPCSTSASQPLLSPDNKLCLAHNGQIEAKDLHPDSTYFIDYFYNRLSRLAIHNQTVDRLIDAIYQLVDQLMNHVEGSYSCLLLVEGLGLVAFRDPHGIRPLIIGRSDDDDYMIASESVCLQPRDGICSKTFHLQRDVNPGECLVLIKDRPPLSKQIRKCTPEHPFTPCVFEYIYLASSRSKLDGLEVKEAREHLGHLLADHIHNKYPHLTIDLVTPVPESSCYATISMASRLKELGHGCKYEHLLTLNTKRKKERSFILPTQEEREHAVAEKFVLPPGYDLQSRSLLVVDDSIVRGTTLKHILNTIRSTCINTGPIYVASVAPPIINRNIFGIDIPDTDLLIGHNRTSDEIAKLLGADIVIYQDLEEMLDMFKNISPYADRFEHSMFI